MSHRPEMQREIETVSRIIFHEQLDATLSFTQFIQHSIRVHETFLFRSVSCAMHAQRTLTHAMLTHTFSFFFKLQRRAFKMQLIT